MKKIFSRNRESLTGAAFVYPGLIYMLLLIGFPIVYNFVISFQNVSVMTIQAKNYDFVGMENYIDVVQNGILGKVMRQTLTFTVSCLVIQFCIGLLLAVLFSQNFKLAKPVRGLLLVIWVVPMTVTALIFKFMFQSDGGLINTVLQNLHLIKEPIEWLISEKMAMRSVIIANCWVGIPFNMILLIAGLNGISPDIYESADIDGAGGLTKFFRITLPMLRPAIMSVLILGVIYTFKVFDLVYVMTSGGPVNSTELLSTYSYRLSFLEYRFSTGSAVANVLFLCLLVVSMFYLLLINKEEVM